MKDICIREEYTNKQGETKVSWNKIGILISANGKDYVKLYHIPNTPVRCSSRRRKKRNRNILTLIMRHFN